MDRQKLLMIFGGAFAAAAFPFKVETVDWAGTGSNYRKDIKRTAVVLQPLPKA